MSSISLLPGPHASESEILLCARALRGKTLRDLLPEGFEIPKSNKGSVGNLIETYGFGIANNSISGPDFIDARIELKILPLKKQGNGYSVKERTKICSINYKELPNETWGSSHAKNKLDKVLFVFYQHHDDKRLAKIVGHDLYILPKEDEQIFQEDWEKVHSYVQDGKAHELSESISTYLAASRSGSGGKDDNGLPKDLTDQYVESSPKALKRAFSLKSSYTNQIFKEKIQGQSYTNLSEINISGSPVQITEQVLQALHKFEGVTLSDFAAQHGISLKGGKGQASRIVRLALGLNAKGANVREFEKLGISFKTIPIHSKTKVPFEAMSFPAIKFRELADTPFYESEFSEQLSHIIFIPIERDDKSSRGEGERIGKAVSWQPLAAEWAVIEKEYEAYRDFFIQLVRLVDNGQVAEAKLFWEEHFIRASATEIIHMRPHAGNAMDLDLSLSEVEKCKYSFWIGRNLIKNHLL